MNNQMSYYAKFESRFGETFRFDTRIYLRQSPTVSANGRCVAAVVGKNPGSAKSSDSEAWGQLELDGDNLLPTVRNIFVRAYETACKEIPSDAFVQIWNLFYWCDKNLDSAIKSASKITSPPTCSSEKRIPSIVWFAWGSDNKKLNSLKERFQKIKPVNAFFYNQRTKSISTHSPTATSFARHTQGLTTQPVIKHLAKIL
jgi:hypothetical protein